MKTRYLTRHVLTLLTLGAVGMGPSCAERTFDELYGVLYNTSPNTPQGVTAVADAIGELPGAIGRQAEKVLTEAQRNSLKNLINLRPTSSFNSQLNRVLDTYSPAPAPEATVTPPATVPEATVTPPATAPEAKVPSPAPAPGAQKSSKWGNAGLNDGWKLKNKEQVQGSYTSSQSPSRKEQFLKDVKNPPALKPLVK